MAVSKRLRFEILRRDNHACRYCGGIAPAVDLTVDHVVPVALGGSDDPTNLVAACKDCNSGKSSVAADAALVDDVSQDALRWAKAMERAVARRLEAIEAEDGYVREFHDHWSGFTFVQSGEPIGLPSDWERTIAHWYALGLPIQIVKNAVDKAMGKRGLRGFDPEFRYMAGVVWAVIREMQSEAANDLAEKPAPVQHCSPENCWVHDSDDPCQTCGQIGCEWACGYARGDLDQFNHMYTRFSYEILQSSILTAVCDRGGYKEPQF